MTNNPTHQRTMPAQTTRAKLEPSSAATPKLRSSLRPPDNVTARRSSSPVLRFSPTAWAKLVFLRDLGETEVGGFAVTSAKDLLLVQDLKLVRQRSSAVSVAFEDEAVADFFDQQVDQGLRPAQFARVWVHTHPGDSAQPSSIDEETFARVFGRSDWAVMFVLAQGGDTHARLWFTVGPGGQMTIPVAVDYGQPFAASDHQGWQQEYLASVEPEAAVLAAPWDGLPTAEGPRAFWGIEEEDWFDGWPGLREGPLDFEEVPHGSPF
jgi:hypothetical protein